MSKNRCYCMNCMLKMKKVTKHDMAQAYMSFLSDQYYSHFYAHGQVKSIYNYIPKTAEYFIVAGPANGDEAQEISIDFPDLKIIGFEPSKEAFQFQTKNDFPGDLFDVALSNENKKLKFYNKSINQGTCFGQEDDNIESYNVDAITMDSFIEANPKINNIVLWADIEGGEYDMLMGFEKYLDRVLCMNLEVMEDPNNRDGYIKKVNDFLVSNGFYLAHRWNLGRPQKNGEFLRGDYIYVRK